MKLQPTITTQILDNITISQTIIYINIFYYINNNIYNKKTNKQTRRRSIKIQIIILHNIIYTNKKPNLNCNPIN